MANVYILKNLNRFAWLAPLLALVFLFRGVLFGGGIMYDGDTARVLFQYLNHLSLGGSFINQSILSGFPIPASVVAGWFYPVYKLMFVFFDSYDTYRFLVLINIVLAYTFAYLYSRKIGFDSLISSIISVVFIFSGQMVAWSTTLTNTNYYFVLPAVLYFAEFVMLRRYRALFLILSGLFLGMSWLSGHSQFILYIHAFLAAYYLYRAFLGKSFKDYVEQSINLVTVYGISLIVGWPQISAILNFRDVTARAEGLSLSQFWMNSYPPQGVVHYILPFFKNPIIETGSLNLYIGILPLILLVFAFLVVKKINNNLFYFYLCTFVIAFLTSAKYSPIALLLSQLPFFDSVRVVSRVMFIGNFAAAMVVGFALQYISKDMEGVSAKLHSYLNFAKKIFLYVLVPILVFGSVIKIFFEEKIRLLLENYFLNNLYQNTSGLPKEHYLNLIGQYLHDSLDSISLFQWDVVVFVVFAVISFYLLKKIRNFSAETFLALALILVSSNFAFAYGQHFNTVSRAELLSVPETARFILPKLEDGNQFRIFTPFTGITMYNNLKVKCLNDSVSEELLLQKELLTSSINMQFGLDSIDGYDPFMPLSVAEMIGYLGSEHTTADYSLAWEDIPMEDRVKKFVERKNILRSMNVRYVISAYDMDDPDFKEIFTEEVGECRTRVNVYELSRYWPRNFITTDLSILSDGKSFEETVTMLVATEKIDIVQGAILSQEYGDDSISFDVDLPRDGLLFIGSAKLPGWRAYVDGMEKSILGANYAYMALVLSKGAHRVELRYK